jgi:redox-sensitive bicupin YhaK (pirin superfamily)
MGVLIFFVSRTFGNTAAATLEDYFGGRVCPNFFSDPSATSPFIMLVHHRHSFSPFDPIRWFQSKFILPEGFPAHPHRGFTTLTYFLKGGFSHRDSLGIAQDYGRTSHNSKKNSLLYHSQWLFTGAGLLHEEMFNDSPQQELFQLWVNVPSVRKLDPPTVNLLGDEECPRVVGIGDGGKSETVILAGSYRDSIATTPILSDMSIFHVTVEPGSSWSYVVPPSFETVILYIRQGSCWIDGTELPVHHTAYLEPIGDTLIVSTTSTTGVDLLVLAGKPLKEPVAAQGSMVMTSSTEINQAYRDYQMGFMGLPWSHELSDHEWNDHISKYPCRYRYSESTIERQGQSKD